MQAACSTVSVGIYNNTAPKDSSIYMKKDGKRQLIIIMNFLAGFTYKKETLNIRANQASRKAILYDTKTILRN